MNYWQNLKTLIFRILNVFNHMSETKQKFISFHVNSYEICGFDFAEKIQKPGYKAQIDVNSHEFISIEENSYEF